MATGGPPRYFQPWMARLRFPTPSGARPNARLPDFPSAAAARGLPRVVAGLALLAFARPAAAIYIRHDRPVGDYNALGRQASFASAGYLADTRYGFPFATGTLVTATKVLTAAHVVDADGDLQVDDPSGVGRLAFGTHTNLPARLTSNVRSVAVNPAFQGGVAAYDLAVITLRSPITYVAPARLSSASALTRRAALVGYGQQGTGTRDALGGADDKLGAHNVVSRLTDGTYLTDFDSPAGDKSSFGGTLPWRNEGTTANGDSGGGLWADYGNDVWRVVGVLNGGYNPRGRDSWYGDVSIFASLANTRNLSFLKAQGLTISSTTFGRVVAAGAGAGNATAGTRSVAVPEPTASAIALPLVGLLAWRRRRRSRA